MQELIHTGSTLLNLALSGDVKGGWKLGRVSNIVGDRSSGKTLLAIEAASSFLLKPPKGIKPKVIYYEAEAAFDKSYAGELGLPTEEVEFVEGETIEHLYEVLDQVCKNAKAGEGYLVVLDSLDALTSNSDLKKDFGKQDYDRKAQKLSELFRKLVRPMEVANMHLMVISQIRENITMLPFAPKWKRSGGKALDFYSSHIMWLAELGKIKAGPLERVVGFDIEAKVTKNKVAKPYRNVRFPLLLDYGIDEVASLVTFLSSEKIPSESRLKKATGGYFLLNDVKMRMNEFVNYVVETGGLYKELISMTKEAWDLIEEKSVVQRTDKKKLLKLGEL